MGLEEEGMEEKVEKSFIRKISDSDYIYILINDENLLTLKSD
jgi:hypothetical protein